MRPLSVCLALAVVLAATSWTASGQTIVGPACPAFYNPFCCRGQFVNGECECWSLQTFGPNCNYDCRVDLCNNRGVCDDNSNPIVDDQGAIVSGTCVCDASGEWFGDQCTANNANPTCNDFVKNGLETDVDCGGGVCPTCGGGRDCLSDTDCASGTCDNGSCADQTCNDGTKNGQESDIDCGGPLCPKCTDGKTCTTNSDCLSGECVAGSCVADTTAPVWVSPQPSATSTDSSINALLRINEPGVVYLVLVTDGATAPTAAEVRAGTAAGGAAPVYSGVISTSDPSVVLTFQIPRTLPADTPYDIYVLAADDRSPPNFQLAATKVDIRTKASDVYPPQFWVLFPRVKSTSDTSVTFETALNEPGTVYFVIVDPSAVMPSAAAVKAASVANHGSGTISVAAAWTAVDNTATGLTKSTTYKAFFAAEDSNGQLLTTVFALDFTTTDDDTPPNFLASTPLISGESTQGFLVTVQLDEPGWFYVVVLPQGSTAPTSLDVVQGVDGDGNAALAHTASQVNTAASNVVVAINDLADDTTYDVWVVAADLLINVQAAPVKRLATTLDDTTPPNMSPGFPTITSITSHSATVTVQLDEPGVCYAVAVPMGATPPTVAQVRSGYAPTAVSSTSIVVSKSSTPYFNILPGLSSSTNYTAYIACDDDSSPANAQTTVIAKDFSTPVDTFAPSFVPPSPSIIAVTDTTGTVEVVLDDPGTVFFVVVARGATAPTTTEVLAGNAAGGASAASSGSFVVAAVLVKVSSVMSGLTKLTPYDVYLVTRDGAGNSNAPVKLQFTTTDTNDNDAPGYRPTYPYLHTITTTTTTLVVRLTEEGQLFYVVTPRNDTAPAPVATQVIGALNQYGTSPVTSGSMVVTAARVTFSEVMTGLTPDTHYTVWIVARDNVQPPNVGEVVPINFQTLPDGSCVDNIKNQAETDVDCGGPSCSKCANGKICSAATDCASGVCAANICVASQCENGVKDAGEADVDCGGTCPAKCNNGLTCSVNTDCVSGNCDAGICQPAGCTPCAADEITVSACSGAVAAVCKVRTPVITEQVTTATKTVVNIAPTTSGSYIVATRNCDAPSCSSSASATTFDDDGFVKVIRTATGGQATFNLFDSSIIRAVSCKAGVQDSDVTTSVVKVNGGDVKVFASTTLYIRALADFDTTRRENFRLSVATVASLDVNDVAIMSAVPNVASPSDSTDVVYTVAIPSNNTASALSACSTVTTVLNNVEGNGNLRAELITRDVVSNGGGTGGGGNQPSGQEANTTPDLFDFTGGVSWLWWLIPLILLLLLCCLCCLCWMRRKEREKYHQHDSFRGNIVPRSNQISPAPSVSSADGAMDDDVMLAGGPAVRRTGNSRSIDDDDLMVVGGAAGDMDSGSDDDGEQMMDLTAAVEKGEFITETIETKGDTVFTYSNDGSAPQAVLPGMSSAPGSVVSGMSRPGSAYADGSRPVGVDDLNALNIRALSFTRNTPGASSYHSLSRANTASSSQSSVASGLRVWAGSS